MNRLLLLILMLTLSTSLFAKIIPENIQIVRDQWGVPHIYAPTDEEVAYGLAWATAEDDFKSMQENYLAVRGRLAEVKGKDGAIMDFINAFLGTKELVAAKYDSAFSPKFKAILEAYCEGINAYAAKFPEEKLLKKDLWPVTPHDIIGGYVMGMALMTNIQYSIIKIFEGTLEVSSNLASPKGSNGLALSGIRTKDGYPYLAINSHQPLEGPFSWYEAHLHSDEGWNILGATFPGGVTIFHGANEYLGWAHTVNFSDLNDVYRLTMHPEKKGFYKFDGNWLQLEEKVVPLKVKIGPIKLPVKRKFYMSVYGPTLEKDGKYYALRFPANMDIRAAEQWYQMNKAQNFDQFETALKKQALTGLNIIYADRENQIFFLDNGQFPKRQKGFDWWNVLPGDTSATLWKANDYYPYESLIQLKNPQSGYVFNTNNTPFVATADPYNFSKDSTELTPFYGKFINNRSMRMQELMQEKDKYSYEDFKRVKFDNVIRKNAYTSSIANLEAILTTSPAQFPKLADFLKVLNQWDRVADTNSTGATAAALTMNILINKLVKTTKFPFEETVVSEQLMETSFTEARDHLMKYFGTVEVPLGRFQRLVRGNKELPLGGVPDVITSMWVSPYKNGRYKADAGESYIELVRFTPDGPIIESVSPYGTSNKPESKHYDDQMELFLNKKLKSMSMNKETILKEAERIYHPQ
jgi:acyl-homoserine-lactone acylase